MIQDEEKTYPLLSLCICPLHHTLLFVIILRINFFFFLFSQNNYLAGMKVSFSALVPVNNHK